MMNHTYIANGRDSDGRCPAGFVGNARLGCRNGTVVVEEVYVFDALNVYLPGRTHIGYEESRKELGLNPYDSAISLAECCVPPVTPPEAKMLRGRDEWVVLWWAALSGGLIFSCACGGAIWYGIKLKKRIELSRLSKVYPGDNLPKRSTFKDLTAHSKAQENRLAVKDQETRRAFASSRGAITNHPSQTTTSSGIQDTRLAISDVPSSPVRPSPKAPKTKMMQLENHYPEEPPPLSTFVREKYNPEKHPEYRYW
jgi:hypothetical protein